VTLDIRATLDELRERATAARWNESWKYDDESALAARRAAWIEIARVTARLHAAKAPNPRIAKAIESVLMTTPAAHWFRVEQVAHVLGPMPPDPSAPDEPSFADHALALLEAHADPMMPRRLRLISKRLMVEASCNESEMSDRLEDLADRVAARFPH
jgi:hypothetical protein